MPLIRQKTRPAWVDRFRVPAPDDLLEAMPARTRAQVDAARRQLVTTTGGAEYVQWLGPWGWTLVYRTPECNGVARGYIVCDPLRPRACIPAHEDAVTESATDGKGLGKGLQAVLSSAPSVDGVLWAVWEIESKERVNEMARIATICFRK